MTLTTLDEDVMRVCTAIYDQQKDQGQGRQIVGIAGPPGSGKSTLAKQVVAALCAQQVSDVPAAALLPMDGFHLDNRLLIDRGLLARKGAPETFNARGFCQAVAALPDAQEEQIFPTFDRLLDMSVAHAIAIDPATPIVVVEGNYLLLDVTPWDSLAKMFCATVFVSPGMDILRERLVQRWIRYGLTPKDALARALENDIPNAAFVQDHSRPADLHLDQIVGRWPGPGAGII